MNVLDSSIEGNIESEVLDGGVTSEFSGGTSKDRFFCVGPYGRLSAILPNKLSIVSSLSLLPQDCASFYWEAYCKYLRLSL